MSAKQAGAASLGMASENFGYSRVRLRRVKKLQFGVLDPNQLVSQTFATGFGYGWPDGHQSQTNRCVLTLFSIWFFVLLLSVIWLLVTLFCIRSIQLYFIAFPTTAPMVSYTGNYCQWASDSSGSHALRDTNSGPTRVRRSEWSSSR